MKESLLPERIDCSGFETLVDALIKYDTEQTGLFFGEIIEDVAVCRVFFPAKNLEESSVRFEMDPWDIVMGHLVAEKYGLDLVAVFHTHPCGVSRPSGLDLKGMKNWRVPWIIASRRETRAFILVNGDVRELSIKLLYG
ncbi:MAG: M67 family metallopeptidase [Desulfurococcales archaeon]|nr:M67 family metallopeptidase [Desulfurococcales archaeon]